MNLLRPDGYVPGWLADDPDWKGKLEALPADDVELLQEQWELAGGSAYWDVDMSWLSMEPTREPWPLWTAFVMAFVGPAAVILLIFGITALVT